MLPRRKVLLDPAWQTWVPRDRFDGSCLPTPYPLDTQNNERLASTLEETMRLGTAVFFNANVLRGSDRLLLSYLLLFCLTGSQRPRLRRLQLPLPMSVPSRRPVSHLFLFLFFTVEECKRPITRRRVQATLKRVRTREHEIVIAGICARTTTRNKIPRIVPRRYARLPAQPPPLPPP